MKEIEKFKWYLFEHTATLIMASRALNIPIDKAFRCQRELEEEFNIYRLYKGRCEACGALQWYLSTDRIKAFKSLKNRFESI